MAYSLGKQDNELYHINVIFLWFWFIAGVCQEEEDKTPFGTMRFAHSVLETAFYEL